MREFLETVGDELRRISSEGQSFVSLDDESVEILKKLAGKFEGATHSAETSIASAEKKPALRAKKNTAKIEDGLREVEFANPADFQTEINDKNEVKIKAVKNSDNPDFKIAPIPSAKTFTLPEGGKKEKWEWLRSLVLGDPVCNEHVKEGKKVVFGVGNLDAKIFFCGEAPGADEEIQGEPFVGRAGQLLTKIILAMGLSREDVYIGNIMNWRPELPTSKGNRPPTEEEMRYCLPYLKAQIEIVNPDVVVALGNTAVTGLLGADSNRKLGKVRGKWMDFDGRNLMITYHPSYLLQYGSPATKRLVWEDMMAVMEKTGIPISEKQRGFFAAHTS